MAAEIRLAIDADGGDHGPRVMVPATIQALERKPDLAACLFGDRAAIEPLLICSAAVQNRIEVRHCSGRIGMNDRPVSALKTGRDSSMWAALEAVSTGDFDAAVSGGNTGALMVLSRKLVRMLPGIDRPALMTWLPAENGHTHLLDLGANIGARAGHLVQFAVMGSVTASVVDGNANPAVGLLNVGTEDGKGHEVLQAAARELQSLPINYVGFVEGHDIYQSGLDVAVCDGLAGNLILKSGEGLARMLISALAEESTAGPLSRLRALAAKPLLQRWLERFDPGAHNGAAMLGLKKVVVKSHGDADINGCRQAILTALMEAERQVPRRIQEIVAEYAIGR
jgi:glycerol-3-phosphate acyltransferase PlsX